MCSHVCFSIIGAVLIVFGLYTVVWGKSKDRQNTTETENSSEGHELPVKDTKMMSSSTDNFDKIEVSVPADKLKGPAARTWSPFDTWLCIHFPTEEIDVKEDFVSANKSFPNGVASLVAIFILYLSEIIICNNNALFPAFVFNFHALFFLVVLTELFMVKQKMDSIYKANTALRID